MTGAEFEGVDIDLLADYVGGALDGTPDEERVARLVAVDEGWRSAYETLVPGMIAVGAVLRELDPEPMPDELATRLDAMFRTGAGRDPASGPPKPATVPGAGGSGAGGSGAAGSGPVDLVPAEVVDLDDVRRRRRWVAPVTVAAAAAALAGFGVSTLLDSPSSVETAAGSVAAENAPMADRSLAGEVLRSGTDYTPDTLAQANAIRMQADSPAAAEPPRISAGGPSDDGSLDRLTMPDAVAACIQEITTSHGGGSISVEFLDYARFNGSPALIVSFSAADGAWVWAVGPDCGAPGAGADERERVPVR